ncbi:hypothetical protein Vadar_017328 [Vaccinium darrowii]|nr:hypothetical protein Vadar_017328 [Vaccinium darrowii]
MGSCSPRSDKEGHAKDGRGVVKQSLLSRVVLAFEAGSEHKIRVNTRTVAYACFLWEIEEGEEGDCAWDDYRYKGLVEVKERVLISPAGVGGIEWIVMLQQILTRVETLKIIYKWMVEGNPCNLLFLRKYAQLFYQAWKKARTMTTSPIQKKKTRPVE